MDARRFSESRVLGGLVFGAGVLLAFLIFPSGLLLGLSSYWANVEGDNAANLIGYEALARDAWRWPPFRTVLLAPPEGVNVLFTDPIPLLALAGKAVFGLTGFLPNYFGFWLLLAYGLQGLAGYGLFRALGLAPVAAALGGLLCLLTPAFLFRYGHFPLLGHWAILVALLLYVRIVHGGRGQDVAAGGAFTAAFLLVNPYLLVMVSAIYASALADAARRGAVRVRVAAGAAVLTFAGTAAAAVALGFIDPRKAPPKAGGEAFGFYSMNLLSPVVPQLSLWPGAQTFVLNASGGQYEGYNWLGFGALGLLALAGALAWRVLWQLARAYAVLGAAVAGMALFAVSTQVYAGTHLVLTLPFEQFSPFAALARVFRSSGRFFWPMGYVLLAAAVVALFRRLRPSGFAALAGAAVVVQAADVSPLAAFVAERATPVRASLDHRAWMAAMRRHDELLVLPHILCAEMASRPVYYELALMAARLGLPTNSVFVNRADVDCGREEAASRRNLGALATGANPLVFALTQYFTPNVLNAAAAAAGLTCRQAEDAYVCSRQRTDPAFLALGEEPGAEDKAAPGERLAMTAGGRGLRFLGAGWSPMGTWGLWGTGPESSLVAPFTRPLCGPLALAATIFPLDHKGWFPRRAELWLNGMPAGSHEISRPGEQAVSMRLANAGCVDSAHVTLRFTDLRSPKELGMNGDTRKLSWGFQSFSIKEEASPR